MAPPEPRPVPALRREDNRFDILRLLAALLVVVSHCYPLGGQPALEPLIRFVGVDSLGGAGVVIFFVLSGYLVSISLERSPGVLEFARRRALRIYPALVALCLLCVGVLGPLMTTLSLADYASNPMTWAYFRNISAVSIRYELPGFLPGNPMPGVVNGSLWSLTYEIGCYVVLAGLGLLPGTLRGKVVVAFLLLTALFVLRPAVPPASPAEKFLGLDYYHVKLGLVFALGAVFGCWRERIRPLLWPALLALSLVLATQGRLQMLLFLFGLGTLALWLALYARWLPRIPPRIGDWSYGAYLYGFPVQQVLAHYKLNEVSFAAYVGVCTVVTFALGGLSWHLVEKQALRWK